MAAAPIWNFCQRHPEESVLLFGLSKILPVFYNSPYHCKLIKYDRSGEHSGFMGQMRLISHLRQEKLDRGYLLTNSFSSALLFYLSGVRQRVGLKKDYRSILLTHPMSLPENLYHQSRQYGYILGEEQNQPLKPEIFVSNDEQEKAKQFIEGRKNSIHRGGLIGMAVGGAYGPAKRWWPERYAELAKRCIDELDAAILIFASQEESDLASCITAKAGKGTINLAGKTHLRELFALIERCDCIVGNDSGVMHVAAALDIPGIVLFGPTDRKVTEPIGKNIYVIDKQLECAPCHQRQCPLKHHACMEQIQVEEIMKHIHKFF